MREALELNLSSNYFISTMPPKNKGGAKGGKKEESSGGNEKVKTANHVKCRHILCEKQSKILEAYEKLQGE